MNDNIILGGLIFIFLIFIIINRVSAAKGYKTIERITTEAGIGSLLAGTFFGVVREVTLNRPANPKITMIAMIFFFLWYVFTKILADVGVQGGFQNISSKADVGKDVTDEKDVEKSMKAPEKKLPEIYQVFVAAVIIFLVIILMVSFYAQRKEGSDKHIVNYNIIITCFVVLAALFTFISGKKIDAETKIRILSYTVAYAVAFGIFSAVFVFKNFSFNSLVMSSLIFFVWLTLTASFSKFCVEDTEYIKRI